MCLKLESVSGLALSIRKASNSFRFLVVKSQGQTLKRV